MVGTDDVEKLVGALTPPPDGKPDRQWRINVSVILGATVLLSALHVAISCGWLASAGISGFAFTDAVQQQNTEMNRKMDYLSKTMKDNTNVIMQTVISGQILTMRASECAARREHNIELAGTLGNQLADLQNRFMATSGGRAYPLEDCP